LVGVGGGIVAGQSEEVLVVIDSLIINIGKILLVVGVSIDAFKLSLTANKI
jgi:hypothetical protein